jgi:hypothetical protein
VAVLDIGNMDDERSYFRWFSSDEVQWFIVMVVVGDGVDVVVVMEDDVVGKLLA